MRLKGVITLTMALIGWLWSYVFGKEVTVMFERSSGMEYTEYHYRGMLSTKQKETIEMTEGVSLSSFSFAYKVIVFKGNLYKWEEIDVAIILIINDRILKK